MNDVVAIVTHIHHRNSQRAGTGVDVKEGSAEVVMVQYGSSVCGIGFDRIIVLDAPEEPKHLEWLNDFRCRLMPGGRWLDMY